jgi:hypothetical protein
VTPACEVVGEDDIARPKTARGAAAEADLHLARENKNVLPPGCGVPIADVVRRETAEHEIGTGLERNVLALIGQRRDSSKWVRPSWPVYIHTIMRLFLPTEGIVVACVRIHQLHGFKRRG